MGFVRCDLPHPIFVVIQERCFSRAAEDYAGIPLPESAADVEQDFLTNTESGVLTLVDDRQTDNLRISFCTSRYELVCGLTQQKDAFFALRLAPLSLRTHNQIARAAVLVVPQTWGVYTDLAELNQGVYHQKGAEQPQPVETGMEMISAAWKQAPQAGQSAYKSNSEITPAQLSFLANVDTLIDLGSEVELEKAARQDRIPVLGVAAAGPERFAGKAYRFQLAFPAEIRVGEYLSTGVGESQNVNSGYDAVVMETSGSALVLRFFQSVELKQLQQVEWLTPKISTKQFKIQHEAVSALRNGKSLNKHLLSLIVENHFTGYASPAVLNGGGKPNPAQRNMIERALIVPDLLLALGPPGTGKTETIREIVLRQAAQGKKVLVTSRNNKAVDNVLEGLTGVQALRIGREEVVSSDVRSMLIDNKAKAMQQKILDGIQPVQQNLDGIQDQWPQIQLVIECLAQSIVDWRQAQVGLDRRLEDLVSWQRNSYKRVQNNLERQKNHHQLVSIRLNQTARRADTLRNRLEQFKSLSKSPVIGPFFVLLAGQFSMDWEDAAEKHQDALLEVRRSSENTHRVWEAYHQFASASEQAIQFKLEVVKAEEILAEVRARIARSQGELVTLTKELHDLPGFRMDSIPALEATIWDWRSWYELMMRRKGLLSEWRDLLDTRQQVLNPSLIRDADVIGATCIGIATDLRFEDLEFDLVIADEAGQIQVMDLLVPLVRANRAVLVGDHLQLPPVVEPELTRKIRENEPENQELGEWLEKSLFERIIERPTVPESHKVMLDTQYRMPRQIADFISGQFYGGNYHTDGETTHLDPFFSANPMVFVDTMREFRHFEQRSDDGQGYFNPLEAGLISDLLLAYQNKDIKAGVIVPYKKQAEKIRRELRRRQAGLSEDDLTGRVATVDSFQGREQDVIIFGFTRSNTEGRIGFLTELRRLNVSLTRARHQLVLVGDSITLTETQDQDFAQLAKALLETVKRESKGYIHANELPGYLKQ